MPSVPREKNKDTELFRNARHGAAAPTEVKGDQLKLRTLLSHVGAVIDQELRAISPVVIASVVQRCPCGQARPTKTQKNRPARSFASVPEMAVT